MRLSWRREDATVFSEEWLGNTDEGIGLKRIVSGGDLGNFLKVLDLTVAVSRDMLKM